MPRYTNTYVSAICAITLYSAEVSLSAFSDRLCLINSAITMPAIIIATTARVRRAGRMTVQLPGSGGVELLTSPSAMQSKAQEAPGSSNTRSVE